MKKSEKGSTQSFIKLAIFVQFNLISQRDERKKVSSMLL